MEAGLSVAVAIDVEAAGKALETGAEVVVVNTASRGLPEADAVARVRAVAETLRAAGSAIFMKKIDSRLKGNVAAESIALADVLGLKTILMAPAIPDQERITYRGCVVGRGVEHPLPIAGLFAGSGRDVMVADAEDDADLDIVVTENDWLSTLAVGARGLGSALARRLGENRAADAGISCDAKDTLCLRLAGSDHFRADGSSGSFRCVARRCGCAHGRG